MTLKNLMMVILMVWTEIWSKDDGLVSRTNEKFSRVEKFVKNGEFRAYRTHFNTIIVFTHYRSFAFDCTNNQFYKLLKFLEDTPKI